MGVISYAVLNDIHFPYESTAYYKALDLIKTYPNLQGIYLNGDVAEIESVSAHPKSPRAQQCLLDELEYVNRKLDQLESMFQYVPVHYICGNHEHRIYRYIRDVAPQLWGMLKTPKLLKFDERPNFTFHEYGPEQCVKVGITRDLYARHEPRGAGTSHAAATAAKCNMSLIYGHTHHYQIATHKKFGPTPKDHTITTAISNGWLGDITKACFDYRGSKDNWVNGFTRIDCEERTGDYEIRFNFL